MEDAEHDRTKSDLRFGRPSGCEEVVSDRANFAQGFGVVAERPEVALRGIARLTVGQGSSAGLPDVFSSYLYELRLCNCRCDGIAIEAN